MNNKTGKTFLGNSLYIKNLLAGMNDDDMMMSTGESNTMGWILGHIVHYRGEILRRLKKDCEKKETEKAFERGAPKNKTIRINLAESLNDFSERGILIDAALEELGDEGLKTEIDIKLPGGKNDIESLIAFLAWHETFHLGQIDLIKAANGKGGIK